MPAIHVYFSSLDDPSHFHQLLYGIEEEGVPHVTQSLSAKSALEISYQAAQSSRLGVGIGIGEDDQIILHYAKLPYEKPLFQINRQEKDKYRPLGANAARMVKGIPFKSFEESSQVPDEDDQQLSRAEIAAIVTSILERMNQFR